ncbi:poly(A) RNA polymerase GLD2 [Dunckerocampus dactyliophorus]|uniref:poly(A) RNA polymerase GLD2 n=1 Tax=Dunckerocampus dactyliophorus TaxID=161453 RepID=UPI0024052E61|nr:poly(A) RNA polymerase GLD2 [Dunckerocampus dactyliophorus]
MFPHRAPPRGHPGFSPGPHRQPSAPMGPHFVYQHRSCSVPAHERLPTYEWTPGPSPPLPPPHMNGWRKRKNEDYRSPVLKRFRNDDSSSFMPYPPNQPLPPPYSPDQVPAGSSRSPITVFGHPQPSPYSHVHTNMPATSDGSVDLQVYAKDKVSAQMVELFEACQQQPSDLLRKEMCRSWLQQDMLRVFEAGRLYMTGSTMSGLASRSSDADLCYVLHENKTTHPVTVLSALKRMMKSLSYVEQPQLIRAKVPILRFREKGSNLEFDLNVNNTVGIRNTFLLRSYAYADPRIRPLILVIKKWARHHQINDASRGTLSSYTLVLMVLHYLQTLKEPVLPSLQRDYPECFDPSLEIDMIPEGAKNIPPYNSQNNSSLGTLLLGFLRYYATEFSWRKKVISVRDAKAFPKQNAVKWRDKFISVEEPFEKNNVARAVHEQAKFDTITSQFLESFHMLQKGKNLNCILPVREIIHKELSWK